MEIEKVIDYLRDYNGKPLKIMEVCGTHTASIFNSGIRSLISDKIKLISGPGCPVCVTPTAYIDKCIEYSKMENHILLTFGDMMKVPGTTESLSQVKGDGAKVELMYSPFEAIDKALKNPNITYVIAAVGFETTAPMYALVIGEAVKAGIKNIKLLTALKTIILPLEWICEAEPDIDGFICPGHVSVVIGSDAYDSLAAKYKKPFVVAGFSGEHILAAIYDIIKQLEEKDGKSHNLYKNAVSSKGNIKAQEVIKEYYKEDAAVWRGLGRIEGSGLYLRDEYSEYDGGSFGLDYDTKLPEACKCAQVIIGRINPDECPMFKTNCNPTNPFGPCMVSSEGACGIWYRNS
ncbi:MAG: hydrogenase formation protein HypD [Eubacteriales bacterium]